MYLDLRVFRATESRIHLNFNLLDIIKFYQNFKKENSVIQVAMIFVCHILKLKHAVWRQACEKVQNEYFAFYLSDAVFPLSSTN